MTKMSRRQQVNASNKDLDLNNFPMPSFRLNNQFLGCHPIYRSLVFLWFFPQKLPQSQSWIQISQPLWILDHTFMEVALCVPHLFLCFGISTGCIRNPQLPSSLPFVTFNSALLFNSHASPWSISGWFVGEFLVAFGSIQRPFEHLNNTASMWITKAFY